MSNKESNYYPDIKHLYLLFMENIGIKIKMLRISKKVSADDLAEALGKTGANRKQYVYDLERGRIKRIDLTTLIAITKKLKVPISYFLDVSETERKDGSDTISIDEKVIESGWREKYYEAIKENSELKTKIIELISTIKD